jgi:hypothetical protein
MMQILFHLKTFHFPHQTIDALFIFAAYNVDPTYGGVYLFGSNRHFIGSAVRAEKCGRSKDTAYAVISRRE